MPLRRFSVLKTEHNSPRVAYMYTVMRALNDDSDANGRALFATNEREIINKSRASGITFFAAKEMMIITINTVYDTDHQHNIFMYIVYIYAQ